MISHSHVEKASGLFFFFGFIAGKLQYLPFVFLAGIFSFAAMGFYLFGYLLWLCACKMAPSQPGMPNTWYGFTGFREQLAGSAVLGVIGTIFCVLILVNPVFAIPMTWLFFVSNTLWAIGEYHKFRNPPKDDPDFDPERQRYYVYYAGSISILSLVTALSTTMMIVFPPAASFILAASIAVGFSFAAVAIYSLFKYTFYKKPTETPCEHSMTKCAAGMDFDLKNSQDARPHPQPAPPFEGERRQTSGLTPSTHQDTLACSM